MAIASFSPTAGVTFTASNVSSGVVIPTTGTPTIALVTNLSQWIVLVALGASGVVATSASLPVMPGAQVALTIAPATNIAAITLSGVAGVNVTVGN